MQLFLFFSWKICKIWEIAKLFEISFADAKLFESFNFYLEFEIFEVWNAQNAKIWIVGKTTHLLVSLCAYIPWTLYIGLTYTIIKYYINFSWSIVNTLHRFDACNHQILYKLFRFLSFMDILLSLFHESSIQMVINIYS